MARARLGVYKVTTRGGDSFSQPQIQHGKRVDPLEQKIRAVATGPCRLVGGAPFHAASASANVSTWLQPPIMNESRFRCNSPQAHFILDKV